MEAENTGQTPAHVSALFAGGLSAIGDGGHQSGIRKRRVLGRIAVTRLGLVGDEIADRRFHGGPDKALNIFPLENYLAIRQLFPQSDEPFVSGSFGENISSIGLGENIAHIGDVYKIGSAIMQISQPRSPCWKLNARFAIDELARVVQDKRYTGWYARVLEEGMIEENDTVQLIRREVGSCTISAFWDCVLAPQPNVEQLTALSRLTPLTLEWRQKLEKRVSWLRENRPHKP